MKGTTLGESKSRRDAWFWEWENFACCLPGWSAQLSQSKIVPAFWIITYNLHRLVVCGIFIYRSQSVCIFGYTPINGMCFIIPASELVRFFFFPLRVDNTGSCFFLSFWVEGVSFSICLRWKLLGLMTKTYPGILLFFFPLPVIRSGRHLDMNLKRKLVWGLRFSFACVGFVEYINMHFNSVHLACISTF